MTVSGKRLEGKISTSLSMLDGYSMRIEDGGGAAKNKQLADFLYFPTNGGAVAIECKATYGSTFPLSRLGWGVEGGQMQRLLDFCDIEAKRLSLIAFEFYGDNYRSTRRLYIVDAMRLFYAVERKSIREEEIAKIGVRCQPVKDYYAINSVETWLESH